MEKKKKSPSVWVMGYLKTTHFSDLQNLTEEFLNLIIKFLVSVDTGILSLHFQNYICVNIWV